MYRMNVATIAHKWMQQQNLADESARDGLHRAKQNFFSQWILESAVRGSKSVAVVQNDDGTSSTEQSRPSQGTTRHLRLAELYEDSSLHWVLESYYGI
ncbi:hypothetical protein V8C42DRAFT_318875 [Trichoderma barbatum]